MRALRALRPVALTSPDGPVATPWGVLSWSQAWELAVPGAIIGSLGGVIAGALCAMSGLSPAVVLVMGVGLALPLALAGAAYEILLARGTLALGPLAPAALVWCIAFPPIRVAHAAVTDLVAGEQVAVPHGWAAFVIYQVLVAVPFAIGFWYLHENFVPRWWFHIRERNPVADHFVRVKLQYAVAAEEEKERQRDRAKARRAKRR